MKTMRSVRNQKVTISVEARECQGEPSLFFTATNNSDRRTIEAIEVVPRGASVAWVYRLLERAAAQERKRDENLRTLGAAA